MFHIIFLLAEKQIQILTVFVLVKPSDKIFPLAIEKRKNQKNKLYCLEAVEVRTLDVH